jgi:hypothetical protein
VAFATAAARTTLTDWQTISGKDVNSKSLASGFTSTSDLHINIANPDAVNVSNAAPPVAGVTNDIDNETRSLSLVDIGADEFILSTCGTVTTPTIATSTYNKCVGQTQTLTATNVTAGAGMVYEWQSSATPGGPYSPVIGGTGANTPIYTTPVLSAGTTYYVLVTTCTVSTLAETSNEVTMVVNTLPNVSVTTSNLIVTGSIFARANTRLTLGNTIVGSLVSNAVTLTTETSVTDSITQLNQVDLLMEEKSFLSMLRICKI